MLRKVPRLRGFLIVPYVLLTFLFVGFTGRPDGFMPRNLGMVDFPSVRSYRQLRYDGVFGQTTWSTCGPAAAATLMHFYYDVDVDEAALLRLAVTEMEATGQDPSAGISALALLRAFEAYGFFTSGYRLTPEDLAQYFRQGGLPVVLHVTIPQQHYVVAVGLVGDAIVVADPSWGRRIEAFPKFMEEKGFSGVTLVPLPGDEERAQIGQRRQRESLDRAERRLAQLAAAGRNDR